MKILIESVGSVSMGLIAGYANVAEYFLGSHNLAFIINLVIFFFLLLSGNLHCVSFCKCENIVVA